MQQLFFSLVIPAHNEASYISKTLEHLAALDYPAELHEIIVVENGSTDRTYEIAKKFETESTRKNLIVLNPAIKGVSKARNIGIDRVSAHSDWVIFLDADTLLKKDFLKNFNTFIWQKNGANYVTGTTTIKPLPETLNAKLWFAFYDLGHRISKASFALEFIKRPLLRTIRFDENIHSGEDIKLIRDALSQTGGKFLFFPTDQVYTSTRRFDQNGWWKTFFEWTFVGAMPARFRRHFTYKVIR